MKKTNYRLIRNSMLAGILFLPAMTNAAATAGVMPASADVPCYVAADNDTEVVKYLSVWDNNGGSVSFPLSERPRIVTDVENAVIRCITGKEEVTFAMADVHKYTLEVNEGAPSGIEDIENGDGSFSRNPGSLEFENYEPGMKVSVYLVNGVMTGSYTTDNDGRLSIPTESWGTGIYLIKTDSVTYKIIKK